MSAKTPIEQLKTIIRENRPNLSANSVTTYASLLKSIYLTNNREVDDKMTLRWFQDPDNIIDAIKDKTANTRKSAVSALTVLLKPENVDSRITQMMIDDSEAVKKQYDSNEMTQKQKDNWISFDKVREVESRLYESVKSWLNQKLPLSDEQLRILTDWLLVAISSGVYFPPRRSESIFIKLKDIDPDTDNYIDFKKSAFILNQYKTAKLYGREEIHFEKPFATLLKKFVDLVPNQTYLFENKGKPFTASYVTFRLNNIFGLNVSTSMLRHIWTSDKYPDLPKLNEMRENAKAMGHSLETHMQYAVR